MSTENLINDIFHHIMRTSDTSKAEDLELMFLSETLYDFFLLQHDYTRIFLLLRYLVDYKKICEKTVQRST